MAKKTTPATSISRDTKMSMKPITDEEFLYGEVWRLHQEVTDAQALSSSKSPVSEGLHFEDVVDKKLAEKSFFDSDFDTSEAKDEKESARSHDHYQHSDQVSLPLSSSIEISLTGTSVSLDESFDLQNSSTSAVFGDQDDNDVNIDLLPLDFSSRLAELSSQAPMESAWSGYDGMTGHHVMSISVATSGYDLAFTDSHGHALNGEDSGLRTLQGEAIYLYTDTEHHSIVFGKTQSDVIIFSAYLQDIPSSTHDVDLWTILYQPLAHPDPLQPDESINLLNKLYVSVSTGGLDNLRDATAGQHLFIMTGNALEAFVITGLHPANQSTGAKPHSGDSVNISHAGEVTSVGSNNQMLDPPTYSKSGRVLKSAEGLTLTFVSGAAEDFTGLNLSPTEADVESNIQFSGLIETQFARFVVSQLQPSKACTLKISALNTQLESGAQFVDGLISGDSHVSVSRVRISDHNGILLEDTNGSANVSYITVSFDSGSATVSGVKQGDQIEYFSESGFNRTVIMNVGSERADFDASFDIGDFSIHQYQSSTVEIGSKIIFEDSAPEAYLNQSVSIDDDALSGGNPGGLGDLEPDSVNVTGILAHSYGADGGSMAWLPIGAPAGFAYELGEDGALLVKQGEATVLTLNLNAETGEYSVIQGAAIQHMPGSDENTQEFTLSYQMVDGDGDMTDGRLLIQVNDDTPTVSSNLVVQIDDDALEGGNPGGLGDVDPDSVNVTGVLAHSYGADGGSMAWLSIGAPAGFAYELGEDGVLLVKQGEATVLTLSLNAETGEYSVIQGAAIQHMPGSDENTQEFTLSYQVIDGDGDMTDGRLLIQVNDDTPTVSSNLVVHIDDDALIGGNPGGLGDVDPDSVNVTGVLAHSYGADGGSMAWLPIGAPAGFAYELGEDGALLVKQGEATVLTLNLNAETGEYSVIQGAAIQHMPGSDENTQEFTLSYQVVEGDGDMTDGRLLIQVNDDTPTVSSNLVVHIDDDALIGGNPGGLGDVDPDSVNITGVLAHSYGADGGSMAWLAIGAPAGFAYELGEDGALLVKQGEATVLTLSLNHSTGEYNVIQGAAIQHMPGSDENTQEFTLSYQVVDGDGDMTDGRLLIQVNDDTPTVSNNLMIHLDDDALTGGLPGGEGDVAPDLQNVTGTLSHTFGADGPGQVEWVTDGAPLGFSYEQNGQDLLIRQADVLVITLTLDPVTGNYSTVQNAPIINVPGLNENNQDLALGYRVIDADGDAVHGLVNITVNDDTPHGSFNEINLLDDDALESGNPGGIGDISPDTAFATGNLDYGYGADGGSIAWLTTGAPQGFEYEAEGTSLLIKQGGTTVMTLTLDPDTAAYTVIQNQAIHHSPGLDENTQQFTVAYRVTDVDGDSADGEFFISVNDDTPMVSSNLVIHLDDDALTGGLPGGEGDVAPDLQNVTGTLSHSFGADGPGQVEWLTDGAPLGFSYEQNGQDLLIRQADVLVITLTLDPVTGNYSTVQNAPIMNEPGLNENNQFFELGYRVTDADGDATDGMVNLTVNDDTPHGSFNEINRLDDDALVNGNPGGIGDISPDTTYDTGNLDYGYGADGGSIAWLTTGAPEGFEYEASGTSLLIKQSGATVLTLTLDADTAAYTVIQNEAIQHHSGGHENTQEFTVAYRVSDGDADIANGEFFISVNDDTPIVSSNLEIILDDDAMTGGNPGGDGDVNPDTQNTAGTLSHSYGSDGGSIAWRSDGAPTGFTYEVSGDSLWIKQGSDTILTLTLNAETGDYVVQQQMSVHHAGDLQENEQLFSVNYELTDGDGDTAQGELTIRVNDDTPVILSIADLIYANTDNPTPGGTGIFSYSVGADQRSSYSASDSDFAMFSLVGQVGVNSITNSSVTWQSESSHALTYDFGFDYQPNPSSVLTSHATGTLSFDKDLGTYSISLSQPLEGMQILTTSRALSFIGYELESSVVDRTQPHVSVAQLSEQMYAQFTAVSEPGGGTGSNNLTATGVDANTNNYIAGEIFTQSHSWVSTSNLSNGVGGDTLQKGEVLDFDLFTANPLGHTDALPTGAATALFLKFDGISSEDFVVILKLSDVTTHVQTTRALVIDGSDILLHGNTLTSSYQIVLDNNDGAVVIEQNDYNLSGENYVITGAQVLTSTEGVTGSGIDFNTVIGAAGASTGSQSFGASTTDNDVIKISDIGVVTQSTATLDSHLDFNFAILDADGDATATQHLSVLMAGSASSLLETLN